MKYLFVLSFLLIGIPAIACDWDFFTTDQDSTCCTTINWIQITPNGAGACEPCQVYRSFNATAVSPCRMRLVVDGVANPWVSTSGGTALLRKIDCGEDFSEKLESDKDGDGTVDCVVWEWEGLCEDC